jgi:Domain of unknown function DUF29
MMMRCFIRDSTHMAIERSDRGTSRPKTAERSGLVELYENDYYSWTEAQAQALRDRKTSSLDWDNLAEEVEDLGKAERHRLESHLELLLMHLLKWSFQPQRRSRSWSKSIREHRFRISRVLRDNPGLKAKLEETFADAYESARFCAQNETTIGVTAFSESCPWIMADALRDDFWPSEPPKDKKRRQKPSTRR